MTATIFILSWLVWTLLLVLMNVRFLPLPLDFPWSYLRNTEIGITISGVSLSTPEI